MNRLSRRQFTKIAAVGAGAHVLGFDVTARSWTTRADAQGPTLAGVPKLDGELLVDESSRKAIAVDWGNLFHRVPAAVLRPRSVDDVVKIVRYANQYGGWPSHVHAQVRESRSAVGV